MKVFLVALLSCVSIACGAQIPEPKEAAEVAVVEDVILEPIAVVAKLEEPKPVEKSAEPEMKRMCITVYDAKLKKDVEKCRTIKTHKKYEGTAVPEKKRK